MIRSVGGGSTIPMTFNKSGKRLTGKTSKKGSPGSNRFTPCVREKTEQDLQG